MGEVEREPARVPEDSPAEVGNVPEREPETNDPVAPPEPEPEPADVPAHEEDDDEPEALAAPAEWFKHPLPEGVTAHEFGMFPECPLCNGYGRLPGDVPPDPHSTPCEDCEGYGVVYTGSKVPGHEQRTCVTCEGSGYVATRVQTFDFGSPATYDPETTPAPEAPGQAPWDGAVWDARRGIWRDRSDLVTG